MSINRQMDKEVWYIYTMEYYSVIKRKAFESVLMRWMNLEPVKQSEVSQKEKTKYCILKHNHGINKDDIDEHTCRARLETQTERMDLQTQ